jgi:hypothetical protein
MKYKIYDDSKNYTGVVVKLQNTQPLEGLDKLVGTTVFGNLCIIPKEYKVGDLFVFFPSETKLSKDYLSKNNMYRENTFNIDPSEKGYFEENGRVKAIKFKGNKCTGLLMPVASLTVLDKNINVSEGDEFNEINGIEVCRKYIVHKEQSKTSGIKPGKILDEIVDSKMFPEHMDTEHLFKNLSSIKPEDVISISIKLHGTSERVGYTKVKRNLNWKERLAKFFGVKVQEEEYDYVVGSRRVVKSVGFENLPGKNHFYEEDLWTKVAKEFFEGKLNKGEMVYFEVIGKDYTGADIQKEYSYGFGKPTVAVYRISNINDQGIEIDLTVDQMIERCKQLNLIHVPIVCKNVTYEQYLSYALAIPDNKERVEEHFKSRYLDKPSFLDSNVVEEGICLRVEKYPRPKIYKLKSPEFLIHEGKLADKEVVDIESNA